MLRTLFIHLFTLFSFQLDMERSVFFSILGKRFDSVVRLSLFMLLVRYSLIFERVFSKDVSHLILLFSFFILVD